MSGLIRPVPNGTPISSSFWDHKNRRPPSGEPGTDYACAYGTVLRSPAAGKVITVKHDTSGAMGRRVIIQFDNGDTVDMIHLSEVWVSVGQRVSQGQNVGKSGASAGGSNWGVGAHVHISLWRNGTPFSKGWAATVDFEAAVVDSGSGYDHTVFLEQGWMNIYMGEKLAQDGILGPATVAAIKRYQAKLGVTADGIWGDGTQAAHAKVYAAWEAAQKGGGSSSILATDMLNWQREHWTGIQEMLRGAGYGYSGAIDGIPGTGTIMALQNFLYQSGYDDRAGVGPLKRDGDLGTNTVKAVQQWLKEKHGYTGAIDGQPGAGTAAAWVRANAANAAAF